MAVVINGVEITRGGTVSGGGLSEMEVVALILANATKLTIADAFPADPQSGYIHIFSETTNSISYVDTADNPVTAREGDFAQYDGTKWVRIFHFRSVIEALITAATNSLFSVQFGATLPAASASNANDFYVFLSNVASVSWQDSAGNPLTSASQGDVGRYDATDGWVRIGNLGVPNISDLSIYAARGERVSFQALSGVDRTPVDAPLQTSNAISTVYGGGNPVMLGSASGANAFTVRRRGAYLVRFNGTLDLAGSGSGARRSQPRVILSSGGSEVLDVFANYHRAGSNENDRRFSGLGLLIVPSDNYVISVQVENDIDNQAADFNLDAGWMLDFAPLGVQGEKGDGNLYEFATATAYAVDTLLYATVGTMVQYYRVVNAIAATNTDDLATLVTSRDIVLVTRPDTPKIQFALDFPSNPESFDIVVFNDDVDSGLDYFDVDLTTPLSSAKAGDVVQYFDFGLGTTGWYKQPFSLAPTDLTDILRRLALLELPEDTNPISAFGPEWVRSPLLDQMTPAPVPGAIIKYTTERWNIDSLIPAAQEAFDVPAYDATTSAEIDYGIELPIDYEPPDNQIGWWLIAFTGPNQGHRPLFLPLQGHTDTQADRLYVADEVDDADDQGHLPYFEVYWNKVENDGGKIRLHLALADNGVSLPLNTTISLFPAWLTGNFTAGPGSGATGGGSGSIAFVTEDLIQLTQWIRSTTEPADPANVTYNPSNGDFEGFPETGWTSSVAGTTGSDQLWMATGTLTRNEDGTWNILDDWTVMSAASSLVRFYNSETGQYQDHAAGFVSFAEIYTLDNGWVAIPMTGRNIIYEGEVSDVAGVTLPSIYLYRIDRLRFDLVNGNQRGTAEISGYAIWGDSPHVISDGATITNKNVANAETLLLRWGTTGITDIQRIGSNSPVLGGGFESGILLNFYRDNQNRLRDFVKFSNEGYATVTTHDIHLTITAFTR